ncbi:hypothetical protein HDE_01548 [Halotydeus destructor]|nr:hypothetical protein HDE_01548 [Halotydeus destructor]
MSLLKAKSVLGVLNKGIQAMKVTQATALSSRQLHFTVQGQQTATGAKSSVSREYPVTDHTYDAVVVGAGGSWAAGRLWFGSRGLQDSRGY